MIRKERMSLRNSLSQIVELVIDVDSLETELQSKQKHLSIIQAKLGKKTKELEDTVRARDEMSSIRFHLNRKLQALEMEVAESKKKEQHINTQVRVLVCALDVVLLLFFYREDVSVVG